MQDLARITELCLSMGACCRKVKLIKEARQLISFDCLYSLSIWTPVILWISVKALLCRIRMQTMGFGARSRKYTPVSLSAKFSFGHLRSCGTATWMNKPSTFQGLCEEELLVHELHYSNLSTYTATHPFGVSSNGNLQSRMSARRSSHVKLDIEVTILDMWSRIVSRSPRARDQ